MYIVRIEDKKGRGPWATNHIWTVELPTGRGDEAQFNHYTFPKFPVPAIDGTLGDSATFRSAAKSIEQLLDWFPKPILKQLEKLGNRLAIYSIPDTPIVAEGNFVKIGEKQVGFDHRFAKRVKTYKPTRYKFAEKFLEKNVI